MARIDQTDDWRDRHAPTLSAFESLAIEAYGNLPEEFRALTTNLTIEIEDFPDDEIFEDMALETPFDLLGLFEGRGISERFSMETGELPNRIRLYRRPILGLLGRERGNAGRYHHPCADPRDRPPISV
jgi:predicted Zn-dependent protease with MMP-like domain